MEEGKARMKIIFEFLLVTFGVETLDVESQVNVDDDRRHQIKPLSSRLAVVNTE
jgi:hypothetical protein